MGSKFNCNSWTNLIVSKIKIQIINKNEFYFKEIEFSFFQDLFYFKNGWDVFESGEGDMVPRREKFSIFTYTFYDWQYTKLKPNLKLNCLEIEPIYCMTYTNIISVLPEIIYKKIFLLKKTKSPN